MKGSKRRPEQVAETIRQIIAEALLGELRDPRIGFVTVTDVQVTNDLSVATVRNMHQNLMFAFFYNAAGVPIAAGVLYPALGLLLSPLIAALAMSLSSASVVGNALRLGRERI